MRNLFLMFFSAAMIISCSAPTEKEDETPVSESTAGYGSETTDVQRPLDVIDGERYIEMAKAGFTAMSNQDLDGFVADFADNAVYQFNSRDSLAGIEAIREYWAGRMEVIETISFSKEFFIPLRATDESDAITGDWLLAYFGVEASYTSGGSMSQMMHIAYHFNSAGKIDRVIQYLDRVPIMQAQEGATTE